MTEQTPHPAGNFSDLEAMSVLDHSGVSMVITDPAQPDNPIVYVNSAFERLTGYGRDEVLGRNCRFLQGPDTDPEEVARLRKAVAEGVDVTAEFINYRADGTPFLNQLVLTPIRHPDGRLKQFLGLQKAIDAGEEHRSWSAAMAMLRETQHRVKNHLALIAGMIRIQGRKSVDRAPFDALCARVESLHALYEELSDPEGDRDGGRVALAPFLRRVGERTLLLDGRAGLELRIDMPELTLSVADAGRLGLLVSEILTNAVKHAFAGRETGVLEIGAARREGGGLRLSFRDDGAGLPEGVSWPGTDSVGGRVATGLLHELGADLSVEAANPGTRVTLDLPAPAARR